MLRSRIDDSSASPLPGEKFRYIHVYIYIGSPASCVYMYFSSAACTLVCMCVWAGGGGKRVVHCAELEYTWKCIAHGFIMPIIFFF